MYGRQVNKMHLVISPNPPIHLDPDFSAGYVDTIMYAYNSNPFFPTCPEENLYTQDSMLLINYTLRDDSIGSCHHFVYSSFQGVPFSELPHDTCFSINGTIGSGDSRRVEYVAGLGLVREDLNQSSTSGNICYTYLRWYRKNGVACGNYMSAIQRVDQIDYRNSVIIFPNPASNTCNITFPGNFIGELLLSDVAGRVTRSVHINGNLISLDLSDLPDGVYLIRAKNDAVCYNAKIVKQDR